MKVNSNEVLQLLPTNIAKSKNFTPKNKYLLATLIFLNGLDKVKTDGYFFRTNLVLAKEAKIAEKNLLINLRKLEQMNFINRKAGKRGEASEYIINEDIIFSYIDKVSNKVSNDSSKVSDKVSDKSSKVSDNSNKVSDKVSDKMSDKVSNNKVSNDSDKVSNKLDNIILRMSVLEELLQQFISTYNSDKVSNEINAKVSTDTDIESDTDIEKEYISNNTNKKDNILNNISNNILEKNLLEKLAERIKDKNSNKECSVETTHSNDSNIVECIPSKSFLFSLVGEEHSNNDSSMKEEVSNKECSVETTHSNEEPKSFPFSLVREEDNSIDANNSDTSTEMPLSSAGLKGNTKDEQSIDSMEKTLENGLKEEILPMKEKEDKTIKECSVCTAHSNGDKFYNDFAFFVEELNEEEKEANSIDANNNTPTEKPSSSAGLIDNSPSEEDVTESVKVQQSEAKERIVKSAEVLIEKLTKILSKEELIEKATLYVNWLEKQKDTINCEELFQSLMDKGSEAFSTTYDRIDGEEKESKEALIAESPKKDVVVDIAIESFDEDGIDEVVSDFFGSSTEEHTHVETKEEKEEEAIIRVLSTGELITVEEAKKRGGALGNDIEDITASRCNVRRRKTDYSYQFQR